MPFVLLTWMLLSLPWSLFWIRPLVQPWLAEIGLGPWVLRLGTSSCVVISSLSSAWWDVERSLVCKYLSAV